MKRKLTTKQQRFIDFYDGNATAAARKAGYKQPKISGHENLTKPNIVQAIQKREKKRNKKTIATREQRQEFWSNIMSDTESNMRDRLRASELLGRSEADFTDKHLFDLGKETAKHVYGHLDKQENQTRQGRHLKPVKTLP